jgi:hypothetical protein
MRIYSNVVLNWPMLIYATNVARKRTHTHDVYRIMNVKPTIIHTYSSAHILQKNIRYYYYDDYKRLEYCDVFDNVTDTARIYNLESNINTDMSNIFLPSQLKAGDVIAIYNNIRQVMPLDICLETFGQTKKVV